MANTKLSKLEFQIMEVLRAGGELSIRDIQERFPGKRVPAYTTIQTTVYRMETKEVVHRVKKVGNFHVFAASITQKEAHRRIVDDCFGQVSGALLPADGCGKLAALDDYRTGGEARSCVGN